MIWFFIGLITGIAVMLYLYLAARRDNVWLDEAKQLVEQEQEIVVGFMHDLVEASGEVMDREALFQKIVHASILGTNALSACIYEHTGEDQLKGVAIEGLFSPLRAFPEFPEGSEPTRSKLLEIILKSEVFRVGHGVIGSVGKSREPILIKNAENDPRVLKYEDESLKVKSLIVVPMQLRSKLMGVLAVANPADGGEFTDSDLSLITSMAEQAALAIYSADLIAFQIEKNKMDVDLSLASSIQRMLLPQSYPNAENLDIHAVYRPAQMVGGDLYDVFQIDGDRIGVAVADVSGKGIPASLLMSICQTNLRHYSRQIYSPAAVLQKLNHELMTGMRQDMFITMLYAIIDTHENTITYARAGHELPILYVQNEDKNVPGKADVMGSEGMALGMVPVEIFDIVIADKVLQFKSGDIMVIYTDGVTESTNGSNEEFSTERLCRSIVESRELSAKDLNRKIIDEVNEFRGSKPPEDDITLVSVKHK